MVIFCTEMVKIDEDGHILQRRMRRRGKLALTQNKPNKCCVKPQRIKRVPLIVLAPFEVPLPIQVSLSLGVILIISLNV